MSNEEKKCCCGGNAGRQNCCQGKEHSAHKHGHHDDCGHQDAEGNCCGKEKRCEE